MGQNFGTTAAQLGGNAVGLISLLESVKHGGLLNALQTRQALQQDPAYRASLIGSPFAAGVNFIGGDNQQLQQQLPEGVSGPPQPEGAPIFIPRFGGPLSAGNDLKDTSARQQLDALRDPAAYLQSVIHGARAADPNARLTVQGAPGVVPKYSIAPAPASDVLPTETVEYDQHTGQTFVRRPDGTVRRVVPGNPPLQGVNIGIGQERLQGAQGGAATAAAVRQNATAGGVPPTSQAPPQPVPQAPPPMAQPQAPAPAQPAPAQPPADPNAIPPQFYVPNSGGGYPSPAPGATTSTTSTATSSAPPASTAPPQNTYQGTTITQGARGTTVSEKYTNIPGVLAESEAKARQGGMTEAGIQSLGSQLSTDDAMSQLADTPPADIEKYVGPQTASGVRGYRQYVQSDPAFARYNALVGKVGLLGFTIGGKQLTEGEKESLKAVIPNLQTASPNDFRESMRQTAGMLRDFAVARLQNEGAKLNPDSAKRLAHDIARFSEIEAKFSGNSTGHPDILSGGLEQ